MVFGFTVPFCKGKQRPRFTKGHAYKTDAETLYEEAIALAFEEAHGEMAPAGVPVSVEILASKKNAKREGEPFTTKPDADNIAKLVLDALNGKAWRDDAQVVFLGVRKEPLARFDCIQVFIEWKEE